LMSCCVHICVHMCFIFHVLVCDVMWDVLPNCHWNVTSCLWLHTCFIITYINYMHVYNTSCPHLNCHFLMNKLSLPMAVDYNQMFMYIYIYIYTQNKTIIIILILINIIIMIIIIVTIIISYAYRQSNKHNTNPNYWLQPPIPHPRRSPLLLRVPLGTSSAAAASASASSRLTRPWCPVASWCCWRSAARRKPGGGWGYVNAGKSLKKWW